MTGRPICLNRKCTGKTSLRFFERRLLLYGCAERMRKASGGGQLLPPGTEVYHLLSLCSQIVYQPPLTLPDRGGKLRLALRKKEC